MVRSRNARGEWQPSPLLVIGLATVVFVTLFGVALWRENALFYSAGVLAALAVLTPLWWSRPRVLLLALALYLPFEYALLRPLMHASTVAYVLPDALLFLALAGRVLFGLRRRERFPGTPLDAPVALLVIVAILSTLINRVPPGQALQGGYTFLRYAAVFYLAATSQFRAGEVRWFVRALTWVAMVQSVITIVAFALLIGWGAHLFGMGFPQGTMEGPNILAAYLAIVIVIALVTYSGEWPGRPNTELMLAVGLACVAILVAISRQGLIGIVIGWVVAGSIAYLTRRERIPRIALWRTLASAGVGLALGSLAVSSTVARFLGGSQAIRQGTYLAGLSDKIHQSSTSGLFSTDFFYNSRLYEIANAGPAILRRSPLLGLGPGTFGSQHTLHDHALYNGLHVGLLLRDPHYTFVGDVGWMNVLGQLGLAGVLGFVWIFVAIAWIGYYAWRGSAESITRRLGLVCVTFLPTMLVIGWVGATFDQTRQTSILLWLLPGLVLSLLKHEPGLFPVNTRKAASTTAETPTATSVSAHPHK